VSTTLVESYRDDTGRPRQRVLTNLHGEPDTLRALAKLAVMHESLSKEREEGLTDTGEKGAGFVLVPDRALTEYNHRVAQIDRQLALIERDMAVLSEHVVASDDEFKAAVRRYQREYCKTVERVAGIALARKQANAALRRKFA
jgi:hypothetical protein